MPIFIALISWSDAWRSSSGAFLIADSISIGLLIIDEIELIPFSCIRWKPSPIEPDIPTEGILYFNPSFAIPTGALSKIVDLSNWPSPVIIRSAF